MKEPTTKWVRTDRPFPLPAYVKEALQRLDEAGFVAYIVGGSVRDFLLGLDPKDHDIATDASPDELSQLFPASIEVGKAFGVLKIPLKNETSKFLEIATFRQDLEYEDHRHPTGVVFSGPREDALRRDFTINGLFYDYKSARILDFVEGMEDLKARLVRAIGNPAERFQEDALRLLRAVRFSTTFEFKLDPATESAIRSKAGLIKKVSGERIRDELTLMWQGPNPHLALRGLSDQLLLAQVLPELEALRTSTETPDSPPSEHWTQTLKNLEVLARQNPKRGAILAWAAVFNEVGKPIALRRNDGKNISGHEKDAALIVKMIGERLKMSRAEIDGIATLVQEQPKFKDAFQMREATLQRLIRQPEFGELLALHKVIATASDGNLMAYQFCASRYEELKKAPSAEELKLISGEDLIQLGFRPGPTFSEILRTMEDIALEKKIRNKEEALEYVIKHFVS